MKLTFLFLFTLISHQVQAFNQNDSLSVWKGFQRLDFTFQERDAYIVSPKKPIAGNPWIWRARFPNWHTTADSILVAEGFHLVYVNTDNKFGSPEAMTIWDDFYLHVKNTYKLHSKVALMGVSRGGLFIYNWAKRNPQRVSCIYAEAPVCDFKSWPGGFGKGEGSPKDWELLKKEYSFTSNKEAKDYENIPLNNLDNLAKAKVPILHMIGLQDEIVPIEENSLPLINNYIKLGGIATAIPCTESPQELKGHHFEIETPRTVADFIKYHATPKSKLQAAGYHQLRGDFANSKTKFEETKKGRVAFLGGSITYGGGWRDSVSTYLTERFPETEFEFINAGISSMGTTPAAFRLSRDVVNQETIDLLFEEAAVNDATNGRTDTEQRRAMEGIIRHLRMANPKMDLVIMHFVDPEKMETYRKGNIPKVIQNHEYIAQHYGISTINLAKEVTERIDNGEFTWEDDFKNLHPSPFGQGVYTHSMTTFLENAYDTKNSIPYPSILADKLDSYAYENGRLIDIKNATGWSVDKNWIPTDDRSVRDNYHHVPMLIGTASSKTARLSFTGNTIGITIASGPDAGIIEYQIDKGNWQELDLATQWSNSLHLPWYYTLTSELKNEKHTLRLRLKASQTANKVCRLRYFYVNE
ncbi:MAG: sialidase-1 [Arcticibacterium sp.]|jgi:sialidase-1